MTPRLATFTCPACDWTAGAPANATVLHLCPKRKAGQPRQRTLQPDAQAPETRTR